MRASATDGAVCQWHTFSADRSGDETNAAFADSDKPNVKIYFLTVPKDEDYLGLSRAESWRLG